MKIRNKFTGQVHEVLENSLYAKSIFEEVKDEDIKVGEPKVEFEIEKPKEKAKRAVKKTKKGAKKNGNAKTKSE